MIRNVVFDVGGVLVRLHYEPFIRYLSEAGIDMSDLPAWLATVDLMAHERGEIGGHELLSRVAAMATRPLEPEELERRWLDMFERWDEMFDLHWRHLDASYGLEALAHDAIASYRVGAVKPHAAIYHEAERRFGLEPSETVFIDDLAPNVAGARAQGWHAIQHRSPAETRGQLQALGLVLP